MNHILPFHAVMAISYPTLQVFNNIDELETDLMESLDKVVVPSLACVCVFLCVCVFVKFYLC